MAKKVMTPEEVQAKLARKAQKRKIFFGTFTKALAFFLAIAMVYSLAIIAFTPATLPTTVVEGGSNGLSDGNSDSNVAPDSTEPGKSKADVAKAFNDATAAAANASYHWARSGEFTKDVAIDPAMLTSAVNSIITAVDSNANLNSVVGGFIGIKNKEADVAGGKAPEGMEAKYLIKATTITANDIASCSVDGNTYTITIKNTSNPGPDSAMGRATGDYITIAEVNESIASFTTAISVKDSSKANYKNIKIVATIEDGKLTNMTLDYDFDAVLDLSIGAKGTGAAKISATYSGFKY